MSASQPSVKAVDVPLCAINSCWKCSAKSVELRVVASAKLVVLRAKYPVGAV